MNSIIESIKPKKRPYSDRNNEPALTASKPIRIQRMAAVISSIALIVFMASCDSELTGPDSEILTGDTIQQAWSGSDAYQRPVSETATFIFDENFEPGVDGIPETTFPLSPDDEPIKDAGGNIVDGKVTLTQRPNGSFHWKLEVSGMEPGNAYTLWILNGAGMHGDLNYFLANELGGRATGGLVNGQGNINAAGNNCVDPLILAEDENRDILFDEQGNPVFDVFGFKPGVPPSCDLIDMDGNHITFVLLEKGTWTPGDMQIRWEAIEFKALLWATFEL
jgi:hypothetical protein